MSILATEILQKRIETNKAEIFYSQNSILVSEDSIAREKSTIELLQKNIISLQTAIDKLK